MKTRRYIGPVLATAAMLVCGSTGCSSSEQQVNTFLNHWETSVSASEYRVQPPDTLEISSAQAPEIDGEEQIVRPDGKITLRLLGEVKVAGLTPLEISRKLEAMLEKYYVEPQVSVRVEDQRSKHYYVFGQVRRAGAFRYTGRDTLLHVMSQSQPTMLAWKSQIKVIHPHEDPEQRQIMTVNAERMLKQGHLEQNVLLQEGDIVYVPATPMAWVGLRLTEALWPVSPVLNAVGTPAEVSTSFDAATDSESYKNGY